MIRDSAKRSIMRTSVLVVLVGLVGGCESLSNSSLFQGFRRAPKAQDTSALSEQGIGKLAKGQFLQAQAIFDQALQKNPGDVHALLGKGIVFQQTGQLPKARAAYQAVLSLRPGNSQKMIIMSNLQARTVRDIASVNLAMLESRGVSASLRGKQPPQAQPRQPAPPVVQPRPQRPRRAAPPAPVQSVSANDKNVISRFNTLGALRDQGLVTPAEFTARRNANIGSLLPLTQKRPSAGMIRSVPSTTAITNRLRAIGRALELRAITVRQHGAERTMIIDGLMPAKPRVLANPGLPPKGLMAAASAVRRLEFLKDQGLITQPEYNKERAAIEKAIAPPAPPKPTAAVKRSAPRAASSGGPQQAVHIASFRSAKAANAGWKKLQRSYRSLLGKLKHEVTRVNLGRGKGVFYRLIAGPVRNATEATRICRQLKRRRQYCEPAFMNGG